MPSTSATSRRSPHRPAHARGRLEWGPAKHDPDHPNAATAPGDDPRDAAGARPDDN